MRQVLLLGLTVLSLAFAPAPFPKRTPIRGGDDAQRIQGTWVVTKQGTSESQQPANDGLRWVFTAGQIQIRSGDRRYDWTYRIDPNAAPRTLDMVFGRENGESSPLKALYSLSDDTLVVAYHTGSWAVRPKSLTAPDPEVYRMTFKRERR